MGSSTKEKFHRELEARLKEKVMKVQRTKKYLT